MSQTPATAPQGKPDRDVLDRLLVHVPALAGSIAGGLTHLPPGSPLRRRLVNLQVKRVFSAMARSDVEVVVLSYAPDAEVWMRSMAGVGISDCYRGHNGIRALYADLDDAFNDWNWTIRAVVDGGDRVAVRGDFLGYGRGSGAETAVPSGGTAAKVSDRGLVIWQEWFVQQDGWKKALEAVGLSE
jgi:SnoaL-like protein